MDRLSNAILSSTNLPKAATTAAERNWPERVIQFGEGNFLRSFVDWMIDSMNGRGLFNGSVVLVQPIAEGLAAEINHQNGLYSLLLRGLEDGCIVEQKQLITAVSRALDPYTEWQACLACAENPTIEFVVSNTTEAGIVYEATDRLDAVPPISFPGKLTVYLYHRFKHFNGDPATGMVILPCELIDRNGDRLREIVLQLAREWALPATFIAWIEQYNIFANTLVDRVVTGYPKTEIIALEQELGYQDKLLTTGELFHLWVIEAPRSLEKRLPLVEAGINVIWTDDMTPYRTRKVRILNGAHTASVPVAYLYGLETVKAMMDHQVLGQYVHELIYEEIVPAIELERSMLEQFADSVIERFKNPFIEHYLLSILLNSSAKFKTRNLPSLLAYYEKTGTLPYKLVFSLAALLVVYKDGVVEGTAMRAQRAAGEFIMKDDLAALEFFAAAWQEYDGTEVGAHTVAKIMLSNSELWDVDLTKVTGLVELTAAYIYEICEQGMQQAVATLVSSHK